MPRRCYFYVIPFYKRRREQSLSAFFYHVEVHFVAGCVDIVVRLFPVTSTRRMLYVKAAVTVLKLLLTTVAFCHNNFLNVGGGVGLEVVVCAACLLTTTSMLD